MAGQLGSQAAQQSERCALRLYVFLPIRAHREVCNGTGRIEEHIIRSVIPRRVHASREKVFRAERIIQLHKSAVAKRKLDNRGNVENVLIVSREEKHLVALDRSAESASELVLLTARLESHKR